MSASRSVRSGLFVIAAAALAVFLLASLGAFGRDRGAHRFETYLEESAQGLSQGSAVRFRGVPVGKVERISFVWTRYRLPKTDEGLRQGRYTRIVFTIRKEFLPDEDDGGPDDAFTRMVSRGLRVHLRNQGVTGLRYLDLDMDGPAAAARDLPVSWRPEHTYVPAAPSLTKTFSNLLESVGGQLGEVDFRAAFDHVATLVSNIDATAVSMRGTFEDETPVFEQTMLSLRRATEALEDLVNRLRDDPGLLFRPSDDE